MWEVNVLSFQSYEVTQSLTEKKALEILQSKEKLLGKITTEAATSKPVFSLMTKSSFNNNAPLLSCEYAKITDN